MKFLLIALMLMLASCASTTTTTETTTETNDSPSLPAPELDKSKEITIWSTFYYAPSLKSKSSGYDVRDIRGRSLGVKLTKKELCNLMLQGSGYIDGKIYGWGGISTTDSISCTAYYSRSMVSGKLKFKRDTDIRGVRNFKIQPFKAIAVDPKVIPYKSVLFIPDLKGIKYMVNGKWYIHDGIVTALDTGGAIKGNHIDFYVGPNPGGWRDALVNIVNKYGFNKFIKSTASGTFKAYIIK